MIKYNFHNHTYRCGHAKMCKDIEYIKIYNDMNFKQIGFSDHMPLSKMQLPEERERMYLKEFTNYKKEINKLRKKYKNIEILIGLECEYSFELIPHLIFLKEKCDYLILGQHYIKDTTAINNPQYPLVYAKEICKAISTGLFDYIAHPDIFLKYRDTIKETDKRIYEQNCEKAIKMICEKAKKINMPLEINLNFINNTSIMKDDNYPYPHPLFYNISKNFNLNYVWGIDAHNPKDIKKIESSISKAKILLPKNLNILTNYNPKQYRKQNKIINKLYLKTKEKNNNYKPINKSILNKFYNMDHKQLASLIKEFKIEINKQSQEKTLELSKEINLVNNSIMDIKEKTLIIKRKKQYIKYTQKNIQFINKKLESLHKKIKKLSKIYKGKKLIKHIKNITINLNK